MNVAQLLFGLNREPTTALQRLPELPPLPGTDILERVTLYVDSVAGNDNNPGTQAAPYRTMARADFEALQYLELRCLVTVQLIGAGPYDMPAMGALACGVDGYYVIKGDAAARTIVATGTATGDFTGCTLPTSALGGTNNRQDEFLLITSGACANCIFQINSNNANDLTVANRRARTANGAVVNGDTFQIIRPGTQLRIFQSNGSSSITPHVICNRRGVTTDPTPVPKQWFFDLRITSTDGSQLSLRDATLGLSLVRVEVPLQVNAGSFLVGGHLPWSGILTGGNISYDRRLWSCGFVFTGSFASIVQAAIFGVWSFTGSVFGVLAQIIWSGGRAGATIDLDQLSALEPFGSDQDLLFNFTFTIGTNTSVRLFGGTNSSLRAIVAAGNAFTIRRFGALEVSVTIAGTSAAFGYDVRGGGRLLFRATPAIVSAVAGSDLRTTNVAAIANAALAAPAAGGNAADALLGEVLARVA